MKNIYFLLFLLLVCKAIDVVAQSDIRLSVSSTYSSCYIGGLQNDRDGSLIVSGTYSRNLVNEFSKLYVNEKSTPIVGEKGFYMVKLDKKKEITWSVSIEIKSNSSENAPQIILDDSSNIYLSGKFHGQLLFDTKNKLESATGDDFIAKYSPKGELKWVKKWTGTSNLMNYKFNIDKDNNLYFIGKFIGDLAIEDKILHTTSTPKSYLLVLDRNGKYVKSESLDAKIEVKFIETDDSKMVYLAGDFTDEVQVQGVSLKSVGDNDIFYAKFDNNLKLQWLKSAGGVKDDNCRGLKVDGIGNAYLAGFITNQANFDDVKLDFNSETGSNIFLTQINAQTSKVNWLRNIEYGKGRGNTFGWPSMTIDLLQLDEKKDIIITGTGTGYIRNKKDFYFYNDFAWVQFLLKYNKEGNIGESKGAFINESYGPTSWYDLKVSQSGYFQSVFNLNAFPRANSTALVRGFSSIKEEKCKENTVLIQRASSGIFSLANEFVDNHDFNYQWYKNGQYLPNENGFTLKATEPGYYSLKLINKTNSACEVSSSNSIPIFQSVDNYPPVLSVSLFSPNTIVLNSIAPKTEWFLDGKLLVGVNNNYSHIYSLEGTYKAKQYFDNGIVKESNEVVIKDGLVLNVSKAVTYDDGDICKPMPNLIATVNNQVFPNEDLKYQWYLNGLAVKDSTFKHFRAVISGEYHAIIFVVSRNQAYTTGKFKIVAEDFPKSLSITKIEDVCGANAFLKVDDSFVQRYGYQSIFWRVDDKVIPDANQPFYRAHKGGFYTFSMQYIEPSTGKTCTYNSFTTFEKKNDFKLNLGYAYAGSGCVVDSFKVFTEPNSLYSYTWTKNDVPIEKPTSSEIFVKDKARYRGIIKRNDGCINVTEEIALKGCTSAESEKFLLINPPEIKAERVSLKNNETTTLSIAGCTGVSFQWLRNATPITDALSSVITIKDIGKYSVQLSKMGCVATTNSIEVISEPILSTAEENLNFNIEVYPNPTEEKLFVSIPPQINKPIEVKITDISGRLMEKYDFTVPNNQYIDLKSFKTGIYLLVFEIQGKRMVKKIIKNN